MISKSIIFDHVTTHYPLSEVVELGTGLALGEWDRDTEIQNLRSVMNGLHAMRDFADGNLGTTSGQLSSSENMPLTINVVRRGILYKSLADDAEVDPQVQAAWDSEDGRGIWGDDGKIDALSSSFLLNAFINGLEKGGFPKTQSKAMLRNQFEHVLKTECEDKSSYVAIGAMRHLYRVMKYCELHTAETRIAQIRRGASLVKNFNLSLQDF